MKTKLLPSKTEAVLHQKLVTLADAIAMSHQPGDHDPTEQALYETEQKLATLTASLDAMTKERDALAQNMESMNQTNQALLKRLSQQP